MQMLRVKVDGIILQIQEYEREGEAIIFLHFGSGNVTAWQPAIPYFQDRYRLILVDLRGHGKSNRPATGYHIDEMARDVAGVMEHAAGAGAPCRRLAGRGSRAQPGGQLSREGNVACL